MKLHQRLASFPSSPANLSQPLKIYWNAYQIPFIEAADDGDLFFAMGAVQAHLRLTQMEVMRRVSQGRLSEMAGPFTTDIDLGLRILNPGKAADDILAHMPGESRHLIERFTEGINFYTAGLPELPRDCRMLGIEREEWSPRDVVILSRLYGVEVNWLMLMQIFSLRADPDFKEVLERLMETGSRDSKGAGFPSVSSIMLGEILENNSKSGSNSFVISPGLSKTGKPLIASDPHVGFSIPNLWMVAGMKSPGIQSVGLLFPGFPLPVLGRNQKISWGGTNGWILTTSLYDASSLPISTTEEVIKRRWLPDKTAKVRSTELGPIITDAPIFKDYKGPPLALKWVGHERSDEFTAFLRLNRANNWDEFREAFDTYSVSAQNFTYADIDGNIGKILAARVPIGALANRSDLVKDPLNPETQWKGYLSSADLPWARNPDSGFIVSANDRPDESEKPLVLFASPPDRFERISALIMERSSSKVGVKEAAEMQMDVHSATAVRLRDRFLQLRGADSKDNPFIQALAEWDGNYDRESAGAYAFELLQCEFMRSYYTKRYGKKMADFFLHSSLLGGFLEKDLEAGTDAIRQETINAAFDAAGESFVTGRTWGDIHSLELRHVLSRVPLLGRQYVFDSFPLAGSSLTVMKTAHEMTSEPHTSKYGAVARHISDLSDPDANFFVLMGGEDGYLGSENMLDQVKLWREGGLIKFPLRSETAAQEAAAVTILSPG